MKRSANVALTLLVPAMAVFGCSSPTPPSIAGGSFAEELAEDPSTHDGQSPEKSGNTENAHSADHATANSSTTRHRGGYIPIPWFIGGRGRSMPPSAAPMQKPAGKSASTPHPGSTPHTSSPSHSGNSVVKGGFGGTGSHLSGAS